MATWRCRGVAEEDYVGFDVAARDQEFFGVGRPAEAVDLFGREMGNLAARFAVEGLQPEVLLISVTANHIQERMTLGSEVRGIGSVDHAGIGLESQGRSVEGSGFDDDELSGVGIGRGIRQGDRRDKHGVVAGDIGDPVGGRPGDGL
jgi:hypothetical protein